jgi:hypothetical protein
MSHAAKVQYLLRACVLACVRVWACVCAYVWTYVRPCVRARVLVQLLSIASLQRLHVARSRQYVLCALLSRACLRAPACSPRGLILRACRWRPHRGRRRLLFAGDAAHRHAGLRLQHGNPQERVRAAFVVRCCPAVAKNDRACMCVRACVRADVSVLMALLRHYDGPVPCVCVCCVCCYRCVFGASPPVCLHSKYCRC